MDNLPFEQEIKDGKIKRVFDPNVDEEELKWHQDLKDREVFILESGGWSFQDEDGLPVKIGQGDVIYIPALKWHRVIKGSGRLVVEITEMGG